MEYLLALGWGLLGWLTRVVWTYYTHSKKVEKSPRGRFHWHSFRRKYDQDWIMGFIGMVVLSLISDWLWEAGLGEYITNQEAIYNPKVNVILGFASIYIIEKAASKSETE